jgi:hypothetical protein
MAVLSDPSIKTAIFGFTIISLIVLKKGFRNKSNKTIKEIALNELKTSFHANEIEEYFLYENQERTQISVATIKVTKTGIEFCNP